MDSPSSSWIFLWMSGYKALYMRLQDKAVATVSKPGWAGKRHSVTTRGQVSGSFTAPDLGSPISCHQKVLVTSQEGSQQQLHTPKRDQRVHPAATGLHPASSFGIHPKDRTVPSEMFPPAPKRSLTMWMIFSLESWTWATSPTLLSWQCPISESVMSRMCSLSKLL